MKLAPIVLFVYNRPEHTLKTLTVLSECKLAEQSKLFIFADGPKNDASHEQMSKITETRNILRKKKWCGEVTIYESDANKGLANSVIDGVSKVLLEYERVIVLEDDILTSKHFLEYMNICLDYYYKKPTIFSISAYTKGKERFYMPDNYQYDVFVSRKNYPWGWATWVDRWQNVDWDLKLYNEFLSNDIIVNKFMEDGKDLFDMLKLQVEGKINSWWIRFLFHHFVNGAYTIQPRESFVQNIGMDGTGVHCGISEVWETEMFSGKMADFKLLDILYKDDRICNLVKKENFILYKKIKAKLNHLFNNPKKI